MPIYEYSCEDCGSTFEKLVRRQGDAVELLRRRGFRAHRMEQGVVDWRARGWRVESGEPKRKGA